MSSYYSPTPNGYYLYMKWGVGARAPVIQTTDRYRQMPDLAYTATARLAVTIGRPAYAGVRA